MNFMRIPNEELLLHYLAQKDNRAFRHLYGVYFVALKSIAIRYVKDDQIACDLVQDVFISLLESTHRFISGDEVKYFLYSALKNRCVSYFRKQQVRDRDLREDRDLLQKDVAAYLKCTQVCYSNYETGKRDIPTEVLIQLAGLYHTSTDYILGLTDDSAPSIPRKA